MTVERPEVSLGDRGGPGTLDRFYHFGEYFKLQALVWRLCLAIGAPGIGFCSLIYMHAYCTWLLRIHNSCHGVAFVLWNSLGNAGEWNYPRESTRPSCHGSHWLWWRNIQIPWVTDWRETGTSGISLCWAHSHQGPAPGAGFLQLSSVDILD